MEKSLKNKMIFRHCFTSKTTFWALNTTSISIGWGPITYDDDEHDDDDYDNNDNDDDIDDNDGDVFSNKEIFLGL